MNRCALSLLLLAGVFFLTTASISLQRTAVVLAGEGMTTRVSLDSSGRQANDASWSPAISADGCLVAFSSNALNLVPNDTNGQPDVFLHDCRNGLTTRLSVASSGQEANGWTYGFALSADGRFVAFVSEASNLVAGDSNRIADVFLRDMQTLATTLVLSLIHI